MAFVLFLWVEMQSSLVNAHTITVDAGGHGDYRTLKQAVENASHGDEIRIWDGVYSEGNVNINRTLNISGNGTSCTVLEFHKNTGITFSGNNIHFTGITLKNGILSVSAGGNVISSVRLEDCYLFASGESKEQNIFRNISMTIHNVKASEGIYIMQGNEVENFTINGKEVYYIQDIHRPAENPFFIENDAGAVFLYNTSGIVIRNNTFYNIYAIFCMASTNLTIENNSVSNVIFGMVLGYCNYTKIQNNEITDCNVGISISGYNNTISRNIIMNTTRGVSLQTGSGKDNLIENNILLNSSLDVDPDGNIIRNNILNSKNIYQLADIHGTPEIPFIIDGDAAYISLENCSNIEIRNNSIEYMGYGISIKNSRNIFIHNNAISGIRKLVNYKLSGSGIALDSCENVTISENTISNNTNYGIYAISCRNIRIKGNAIRDNGIGGIYFYLGTVQNLIENNIINETGESIHVEKDSMSRICNNTISGKSLHLPSGNIVENNTFNSGKLYYLDNARGNRDAPIIIEKDASAILLYNTSFVEVLYNTLQGGNYGLYGYKCNNLTIKDNIISEISHCGVYLIESRDILILNNTFSRNTGAGLGLDFCSSFRVENNLIAHNMNGLVIGNADRSPEIYRAEPLNNYICNNEIQENDRYGLFIGVLGYGNTIRENRISGNMVGVFVASFSSYPDPEKYNEIIYNQIYNNSVGLNYTGRTSYSGLQYNYWGDPSGPYNPEKNPEGKGNAVVGNVSFTPWLKSPDERIREETSFPWWLIKNIIILAGLIALAYLVIYPFFGSGGGSMSRGKDEKKRAEDESQTQGIEGLQENPSADSSVADRTEYIEKAETVEGQGKN